MRDKIEALRQQGYTDTQILELLFPNKEEEQPNQDNQPEEDDSESDSQGDDDSEGEEGDGDSSDDSSPSNQDSDEDSDEGENLEEDLDSDTQGEPESDEDTKARDEGNDQDSTEPSEDEGQDEQNLGFGGIDLPQGFTPPKPKPNATKEARQALLRWIKQSLGGKIASPRRDATRLCVRMVSRASLQHTHKLENTKKRLLVVIDVSSSCGAWNRQYIELAHTLATLEPRLAVLLHSNGVPVKLTVDGKERSLVRVIGAKDATSNTTQLGQYLNGIGYCDLGGMGEEDERLPALWRILNGLNLQGVLALGDSDATVMLRYLSNQANVCYIARNRSSVREAKDNYRMAKRLSEKGCIPVVTEGDSVNGILQTINKLPRH